MYDPGVFPDKVKWMVVSLVVGGAGFVGSHLTESLVQLGGEVAVIDDLSNGSIENLSAVQSKITFQQNDVTLGIDALQVTKKLDEIYNLACYPRQISFADPLRDSQVNLGGTIICAELARRTGAKLLFTSNTGIVSNPPSLPVDETCAPNPLTPYDVHKLASEYLLKAYHKYYGTSTVSVRFASVYGPRQRVNEKLGWKPVVPEFATRLLRGKVPTIDGNGKQTRDLLYVKDAVAGVIQAMHSNAPEANSGGVFILGTNRETSINDIYRLIAKLLTVDTQPKYGPAKAEDIMRMCYDYKKAKSTFGFEPRTTVEDGLRETIDCLRDETEDAKCSG